METSDATRSVLVSQKMSVLKQGINKSIIEYLDCCDDLEAEIDAMITQTIEMQIVHRLNNKPQAKGFLYNLSKEHNFSHGRVKELIVTAMFRFPLIT